MNTNDELGDDTQGQRLVPTQIGTDTSWLTVIDGGPAYSAAVEDRCRRGRAEPFEQSGERSHRDA